MMTHTKPLFKGWIWTGKTTELQHQNTIVFCQNCYQCSQFILRPRMRGLSGTNATVLPLKTVAPTGSPSKIPSAQAPRLRTMGLQRRPHVSFSRTEGHRRRICPGSESQGPIRPTHTASCRYHKLWACFCPLPASGRQQPWSYHAAWNTTNISRTADRWGQGHLWRLDDRRSEVHWGRQPASNSCTSRSDFATSSKQPAMASNPCLSWYVNTFQRHCFIGLERPRSVDISSENVQGESTMKHPWRDYPSSCFVDIVKLLRQFSSTCTNLTVWPGLSEKLYVKVWWWWWWSLFARSET